MVARSLLWPPKLSYLERLLSNLHLGRNFVRLGHILRLELAHVHRAKTQETVHLLHPTAKATRNRAQDTVLEGGTETSRDVV